MLPASKLARLTAQDKIRYVYQYHLEEQYADTSSIAKSIATHQIEVLKHGTVHAEPLSISERLCLQLLKGLFVEGAFYALPSSLLMLATKSGAGSEIVIDEQLDILKPVEDLHVRRGEVVLDGSHVIVSISNLHPEQKTS